MSLSIRDNQLSLPGKNNDTRFYTSLFFIFYLYLFFDILFIFIYCKFFKYLPIFLKHTVEAFEL
jgi:hypothetical protein